MSRSTHGWCDRAIVMSMCVSLAEPPSKGCTGGVPLVPSPGGDVTQVTDRCDVGLMMGGRVSLDQTLLLNRLLLKIVSNLAQGLEKSILHNPCFFHTYLDTERPI